MAALAERKAHYMYRIQRALGQDRAASLAGPLWANGTKRASTPTAPQCQLVLVPSWAKQIQAL